MENLTFFLIHIICYWTMVLIYDVDVPKKDLRQPIVSSLKNQVLYTLPITVAFNNYYPIVYDDVLLSFTFYPFSNIK